MNNISFQETMQRIARVSKEEVQEVKDAMEKQITYITEYTVDGKLRGDSVCATTKEIALRDLEARGRGEIIVGYEA